MSWGIPLFLLLVFLIIPVQAQRPVIGKNDTWTYLTNDGRTYNETALDIGAEVRNDIPIAIVETARPFPAVPRLEKNITGVPGIAYAYFLFTQTTQTGNMSVSQLAAIPMLHARAMVMELQLSVALTSGAVYSINQSARQIPKWNVNGNPTLAIESDSDLEWDTDFRWNFVIDNVTYEFNIEFKFLLSNPGIDLYEQSIRNILVGFNKHDPDNIEEDLIHGFAYSYAGSFYTRINETDYIFADSYNPNPEIAEPFPDYEYRFVLPADAMVPTEIRQIEPINKTGLVFDQIITMEQVTYTLQKDSSDTSDSPFWWPSLAILLLPILLRKHGSRF